MNFVKLVKNLADNWKDFQNGNVTREQRARIESGLHKVYEIIKDNAYEIKEKGKVYKMKENLRKARSSNKKLRDESEIFHEIYEDQRKKIKELEAPI